MLAKLEEATIATEAIPPTSKHTNRAATAASAAAARQGHTAQLRSPSVSIFYGAIKPMSKAIVHQHSQMLFLLYDHRETSHREARAIL
jgi:hypothetical protein